MNMKKILTLCCVLGGLMLPMAQVTSVQAEPPFARHEGHGQIHAAIHALENAREHLRHANHDFGGHREAALRSIDEAIAQLRQAESFDRY